MTISKILVVTLLVIAVMAAAPEPAEACPGCFGAFGAMLVNASPYIMQATNWVSNWFTTNPGSPRTVTNTWNYFTQPRTLYYQRPY